MQKWEVNDTDLSGVEFYALKFDESKRERLMKIRAYMRAEYPDSTERIYYGIPTVERNGTILLQYAAYKTHISLIVCYELSAYLQEKYPQYRYTRATVVFRDNEPFPDKFVKQVCKLLDKDR